MTAWMASSSAPVMSSTTGRAPRCTAHTDNAALLGGVAGHAGAFSTARDPARCAEYLIDPAGRLHGRLRTSTLPFARIDTGLDRGLSWEDALTSW